MKNIVVNIGSFHIEPSQPIAVISRKIKHKHIQKENTFPRWTADRNNSTLAFQEDSFKADPLTNMPRGLVIFAGSERRLLSHPDCPQPQAVIEIRLRGSGLSIHGHPLRAVPGSPHFYEVHGCGSFPACFTCGPFSTG